MVRALPSTILFGPLPIPRTPLVGRGDELAAALFISPKTVGLHVSHILGKLGVLPAPPPSPTPTGTGSPQSPPPTPRSPRGRRESG